jgi:hypothetical protein
MRKGLDLTAQAAELFPFDGRQAVVPHPGRLA